jgi:FixJ family two-component response regulator
MTDPAPAVFVIDDDSAVRKALGRLLRAAGFRTTAFASAEEFLARLHPDAPACVVLDVRMPGMSGLDLQRILAGGEFGLPVVFITGHGDIPMSVRAMKAGAVDFLVKPFDPQDLLVAVRQALVRHAQSRQAAAELTDVRRRAASLSPRERAVLERVVRGLLNKETGRELGVTEKTVKAHRARVMHKMRARSLADLVRLAEKLGIPLDSPRPGSLHAAVAPAHD